MWALAVAAHGLRRCGSGAPEYRLNSCGIQSELLHSTWDLPRAGIKPVSSALAGGFYTTEPPGKPGYSSFYLFIF